MPQHFENRSKGTAVEFCKWLASKAGMRYNTCARKAAGKNTTAYKAQGAADYGSQVKGKQVKILYELVTVMGVRSVHHVVTGRCWEGRTGCPKPGNLPCCWYRNAFQITSN